MRPAARPASLRAARWELSSHQPGSPPCPCLCLLPSGTSGASRRVWGQGGAWELSFGEPLSHMSKGQVDGGTEPALSMPPGLSSCPWMLLQFTNAPGAGGTSHLRAERSFLCDGSSGVSGHGGWPGRSWGGCSGAGSLAEVIGATAGQQDLSFPRGLARGSGSNRTAEVGPGDTGLRAGPLPGCAHPPALLLPRRPASPKQTVSPRDSRPASGGGRRPSIRPRPGTLMSRPPNR